MHVIVVGCGRVGSELAERMLREGHTVTVMDKNRAAFRRLPEPCGGDTVVGFGFDQDDLLAAGIERSGAVAAVTSGDNSNILTARIARETFEVPHVVARIYDPRRAAIYQRLGIATVATVSWTVDQVARRLIPENVSSAWTDPSGAVSVVEYPLPDALCGRSLAELAEGDRYRPILLTRGGASRLVTPSLIGQEGDTVYFAVRADAQGDLQAALVPAPARASRRAGGAGGAGRAGGFGAASDGPAGPDSTGSAGQAAAHDQVYSLAQRATKDERATRDGTASPGGTGR